VLNYDEDVTFTYQIVDQYGGADEAMVTISVQGINDAPVSVNDSVFTFEDVSISIPALENDFDVDEDVLSIDSITGPFHGTAVISGTTEIFYDPDPGYIGSDSFYYIVSDGVLTDTGTIYITIDETNDPPQAVNDSYNTGEDTPLNVAAPGVLGNDYDQEMLPLTAVLDGAPAHGEVTLNADGSFTYVPAADYNGSDSFTYVANDGYSDSNVATVYINITPLNDAPVAVEDTYYVLVDGSLTVSAPGVLGNDTDLEGDSLSAALDASPSHGTVTLYGNGSFVYTPDSGYLGTDTFTYSVSDGHGGVSTGTVVINVVEELPALYMYVPMVAKH
jgi:VCBS repeat-containing protein